MREVALHERLGLRPDAVRALGVDHAAIDEPGQRVVEGRELLGGETIVGVIGVQEVEGVLEIDVMRMTSLDRVVELDVHRANHNIPIDRLRASGYIGPVT